MKITAVITLLHPQSRAASDRWGSFLRINGERNHWWLGRKLTVEEFNEEFPKAVKFAGPDRPLVGLIFVEGEGDAPEATEPVATITVEAHDAQIADIQAGVDAWQADQNLKLEAAATQIADLEQARLQAQARIFELENLLEAAKAHILSDVDKDLAEDATTTISEELDASASASPGSVPDSSGATNQADPPATPAKKKAKK